MAQKNKDLIIDEQSKEYWRWRDSILMYEELMLEILTFDLMVANPYEQLWNQLHKLDLIRAKDLRSAAWSFCNDTAMTTLPLLLDASDIAMAAIFFASVATKRTIDDVSGEAWWKFLKGNEERIIKAIDVMEASYADHPLKKNETLPQGSPQFILESTRRRGEALPSQTEAGSSRGGTPMDFDGASQSPRAGGRTNGRADRDDEDNDKSNGKEEAVSESQVSRGDSDAVLKAAANGLDVHKGRLNEAALLSPSSSKRKSAEPDMTSDSERQQKRARHNTDEDP